MEVLCSPFNNGAVCRDRVVVVGEAMCVLYVCARVLYVCARVLYVCARVLYVCAPVLYVCVLYAAAAAGLAAVIAD